MYHAQKDKITINILNEKNQLVLFLFYNYLNIASKRYISLEISFQRYTINIEIRS